MTDRPADHDGHPDEPWDPRLDEPDPADSPDSRPAVHHAAHSSVAGSIRTTDAPLPQGITSVVHTSQSINGRESSGVRVTYADGRNVEYPSLHAAPAEVRAFLASLPMPQGPGGSALLDEALRQLGATRASDGAFELRLGRSDLPPDLRDQLARAGLDPDDKRHHGLASRSGFTQKLIAAALLVIAALLLYLVLA